MLIRSDRGLMGLVGIRRGESASLVSDGVMGIVPFK